MRIRAQWRDILPKSDLQGGYLGDGYPLCADLPAGYFLRRGAHYKYKGPSSGQGASYDRNDLRLTPDPTSSALYR